MRTKKESRDYAREYYRENLAKKKIQYENERIEDKDLSKALGAKINSPVKYNNKKERRLQEKITETWHLTGQFVLPDKKVIKQIEQEILKEEMLYEDTIEDVELEELKIEDENYFDEEE